MIYRILILCFSLSLTSSLKANDIPSKMLEGKQSITIPFEFMNGYIVTQIRLNDVITLECIFDTGAEHTLLFNPIIADILALPFTDTVKVYGTDFVESRNAYITRESRVGVGTGASIDYDLLFLEGDIYNFNELVGYQIDGILGLSFFKNLGVSINYVKRKIHVFKPSLIKKYVKKGYAEEAMKVQHNKVYITITNSNNEDQLMLLDSGANLSMLEYIDAESEITSKYVNGILGRGLGGDILGYCGVSDRKTMLGNTFESTIVNYQIKTPQLDSFFVNSEIKRSGLIGNQIIKQFDVVVNLLSETIYTRPNKYFSKEAVYNKSGMEVVAFGREFNQFYVHTVLEKSPAAKVDIKKGDIILSINRIPLFLWNINSIKRLLSSKKNKSIHLKLMRDGNVIHKRFKLSPYLD